MNAMQLWTMHKYRKSIYNFRQKWNVQIRNNKPIGLISHQSWVLVKSINSNKFLKPQEAHGPCYSPESPWPCCCDFKRFFQIFIFMKNLIGFQHNWTWIHIIWGCLNTNMTNTILLFWIRPRSQCRKSWYDIIDFAIKKL